MSITSPQDLKSSPWLILESLSGSRAYGLATPNSDTDIKGVFVLPPEQFYSFEPLSQINNSTNDIVYYELKKFMDLVAKNNPNILELLYSPAKCTLIDRGNLQKLRESQILSKLCYSSFAGYALSQIRKARGLNKKVLNPLPKERKQLIDFCYILQGNHSEKLSLFLHKQGLELAKCGLAKLKSFPALFALYYDASGEKGYSGITRSAASNAPALSSIPKGEKILAYVYCHQDAYSSYCKQYREYWEWVEKRNEDRYLGTLAHGKGFDAKNMMHTFRLLEMAEGIARHQTVEVESQNRDFLLKIKAGGFSYQYLVEQAEKKLAEIEKIFQKSNLPEEPDYQEIENQLIEIRAKHYRKYLKI